MPKEFNLMIVTPKKKIYDGKVASLLVPAALGYLGVLADHAPLIANLTHGKIVLKEAAGRSITFSSEGKGFLEIMNNAVTIILERPVVN